MSLEVAWHNGRRNCLSEPNRSAFVAVSDKNGNAAVPMKPTIKRLHESLIATQDGKVACDAINALTKHATKGDADAKAALAEYTKNGQVTHIRTFACSSLARIVNESDRELAHLFEQGLSSETTRYWSILGYLNTLGHGSYDDLTRIVIDESLPVADRGHAIKCLARHCKQPFDRQLPSDPGRWRASDLRIDEVAAWSKAGCPGGTGHPEPRRHPALDKPETDFEKIVSRFDKLLAKKRDQRQDLAAPTDWLAVADPGDLQQITTHWALPSVYVDFLTRFSPVKVSLVSKRFWNGGLQLFGVDELIEAQDGYAFNPVKKESIPDWPKDFVVIASHGGDPFVLDLSSSDGVDAPVLTAEHGTGEWDFDQVADSFGEFLKSLVK